MLKKDVFFLMIGVIGSLISLIGLIQDNTAFFYVIGSMLLFFTASHFKLLYFIALEIILFAGHGATLLGIGPTLQAAIPVLLCVQLSVFYLLSGQLNNIFLIIGIIGIAMISVGFAYENQWVFFIGSTAIAIFSYSSAYKTPVVLIWAVINTIFALTAIIRLVFL